MPTLAFGLRPAKQNAPPVLAGQKRKQNLFDDDAESDNEPGVGATAKGSSITSKTTNTAKDKKYSNLSALHSAQKHTKDANNVDASIYDYDNAYDTFHAPKEAKTSKEASGPKYMSSLIQSAEVRKRDQLRAQERLLQKEREAEGDEFADKEKFVTGAYKAQQDEVRRMEEAEAKREAEEEERKRKGGGMSGFYKDLLKKDEERSLQIAKAAQEAATKPKAETVEDEAEETDAKLVEKLKEKGAHIIVNDDGEIVDKRQLLAAGLNVAKKPKLAAEGAEKKVSSGPKPLDYSRSAAANAARQSQRERQTRIMAAQLEEMAQKQAQQEAEERKAMEEKVKSQKTDSDILSAKERYLARKRERDEEAKKAKASAAS
jgi:coiled-coil domain-containing protein 55